MPSVETPWDDEEARNWLHQMDCWPKLARLVQGTLRQDPNAYPHQMRAAAAIVILIARDNLWPADDPSVMPLVDVVALARRQLTHVKQRFSVQTRQKRELIGNPVFRSLMETLDEEIRILEARIADPPIVLNDKAPGSWQDYWSEQFEIE